VFGHQARASVDGLISEVHIDGLVVPVETDGTDEVDSGHGRLSLRVHNRVQRA
jgi:hypothetical protein